MAINSKEDDRTFHIPPAMWKVLFPSPRDDTVTWDFTPFLQAPAVKNKSREEGKVNLLNIPNTKIPSPLANNLSPRQILDIKALLVGENGDSECGGNGKEIWLSWKRAWDIWNNYYIEGRVNPIWIREEWERRELAKKEWDTGRDTRRRKRENDRVAAVGGHPPVDPAHNPFLPADQVPRPKPPHVKGFPIPTDLRNESGISRWAPGQPKLRMEEWDSMLPNTTLTTPVGDDEKWLKVTTTSGGKNVKATTQWVLIKKTESDYESEKAKSHSTTPWSASFPVTLREQPKTQTTQPDTAPPKPSATEHHVHHQYTVESENEEDEDGDDMEMPDILDDCDLKDIIDDVESESDSEPPPKPPVNPDGSSGGWFPLKELEEYYEPEGDHDDDKVWTDAITNTVWMPRRVGEKTLKIALDEDIEVFCKSQEFKVDGGMDCGRSPFPVLRPVAQYVHTPDGGFRKKKAWDGVTGTLFNMPTQPLEPCVEILDEKTQRIKDIFSDPLRDNPHGEDSKLFPLDIRRVFQVAPQLRKPRNICEEGEELVRDPTLYPKKEYREMKVDDPWWVNEDQKLARDAPPRRHPPIHEDSGSENLPLDHELWNEEVARDLNHEAGYFVTNLHGGTLIVNGMEIKKGDVAGPLPEFAIIECPGGQVAFWWGVGGRHWGHGPEEIDFSAKWDALRVHPGWEHIAKSAGEVWDAKIRDRKEREKTGENEDDDEEWARWKRAKTARSPSHDKPEPTQLGRYGPIPVFTSDEEELKWLNVQSEEKQRMLTVYKQASSLIYPTDDAFWTGTAPPVKLSHELSEAEKDSRWRTRRKQQLELQHKINKEIQKREAARLAWQMENEKRKAEEYLQSAQKRRKLLDQAALEARDRAVKAQKDAEDVKNRKILNQMIKKKQLEDAAVMAALKRDKGVASDEEALALFEQLRMQYEDELEQRREEVNKLKREKGLPEVPPADRIDIVAIQAAQEKAREDTLRMDADKRVRDATRNAQDLADRQALRAKRDAEDKKRREDAATFASSVQGQLAVLRDHYYNAATGTARLRAAQAYLKRHNDRRTNAEHDLYIAWQKNLTPEESLRHQQIFVDASWTVRTAADQKTKLTEIEKPITTKPPTITPPASTTASPLKTPPVLNLKPAKELLNLTVKSPSSVNLNLQHAIDESTYFDDIVLQQAILNSINDFAMSSHESLKVRATTVGMTELEYVKMQNFDTVEAYLADQTKKADLDEDEKPRSPISDEKVRSEAAKDAKHLELYKGAMRNAIREGIRERARYKKYRNPEDYAAIMKKESVDAWVDEELQKMNITLDMIPTRKPKSELSNKEDLHASEVWRDWVARLNKAADWKARIGCLPKGPNWTTPQEWQGEKWCLL